jgi:hypothetical protein
MCCFKQILTVLILGSTFVKAQPSDYYDNYEDYYDNYEEKEALDILRIKIFSTFFAALNFTKDLKYYFFSLSVWYEILIFLFY